jgi:RecA/RadA recombinase
MAKQKTSGKQFTFSQVGDLIKDISKKVPIIIADENEDRNQEYLDTGIYILNAALSGSLFGGLQSNRISVFAGDSGAGKSFLCYSVVKQAQKNGWNCIYIDTEFSIQRNQLPNYGIDINGDRFQLIRSNIVEDIIKLLAQILEQFKEIKMEGGEIPKTLVILDSVGMLASRKESEDAKDGAEKVDMSRAKKLASMFRIINGDLGYLNIPLICTNHVYDEMSMFPKKIMKGGTGLYYSASVVSFLSKAKLKEGEEDDMDLGQSGITVTFKTEKNRLAKPKKVKFDISFVKGCNPYKGLEAFCRPEFFDTVGIGMGKWEQYPKPVEKLDKTTGEVIYKTGEFKAGGNRWYVKHLGGYVNKAELFSSKVFTQDVLEALEPIVNNYFKYKSLDELDEYQKQFEEHEEDDMDENQTSSSTSMDDLFD